MYNHADQTWKDKPRLLSLKHQELLAQRLREYAKLRELENILIIFHGGEPLLFGADNLVQFAEEIKAKLISVGCNVDFGIQTNGVLLKKEHLEMFQEHEISVSLSIDGPQEIHDQFRLNHQGKPSFEKVYKALLLLKQYPRVFTGCLSVINPRYKPDALFSFFDQNGIEDFNILLPDANYINPPPGRAENPDLYLDWLIEAFDTWFDHYPHIKCKLFESILRSFSGHQGHSDALGLGDVSMLNLETDGSYHDLDVLKITEQNSSDLGMHLETDPIESAEKANQIQFHRSLLTFEGLSEACKSCDKVNICGGGSVPHRFSKEGYQNPTVYCREMYALIDHMYARVLKELNDEFDAERIEEFWNCATSSEIINDLREDFARKNFEFLRQFATYKNAEYSAVREKLLHPLFYTWLLACKGKKKGEPFENLDGELLFFEDEDILDQVGCIEGEEFVVQEPNRWYQQTLGVQFKLEHSPEELKEGLSIIHQALDIVKEYNPKLLAEMKQVSRHIQIIRYADPENDTDVSFSDETLPGVLFIGAWKNGNPLSPYQVAESLIHEHLHQKLYLLQKKMELLSEQDLEIYLPWPKKHYPPSGAIHGVYVFVHIIQFLDAIRDKPEISEHANKELALHLEHLNSCIDEIAEKVVFTEVGQLFFDRLMKEYRSFSEKMSVLV